MSFAKHFLRVCHHWGWFFRVWNVKVYVSGKGWIYEWFNVENVEEEIVVEQSQLIVPSSINCSNVLSLAAIPGTNGYMKNAYIYKVVGTGIQYVGKSTPFCASSYCMNNPGTATFKTDAYDPYGYGAPLTAGTHKARLIHKDYGVTESIYVPFEVNCN